VSGVREFYEKRVAAGELERDPAQENVVARLDRIATELSTLRHASRATPLERLFASRKAVPAPRGLYVHGPVGRGKTMLMDMFFQAVDIERKRRTHFHAFMADAHARIYEWRQKRKLGVVRGEDPIAPVAEQIAAEARLLCFDEFAVTDIADAMVLGRLFTRLFELGAVLVATSNVAPARLYEGGLNRALFLPFIALLEQRVEIVELKARADYRLEKLAGVPTWMTPADAAAKAVLDRAFLSLTGRRRGAPESLSVFGRDLIVPESAENVARFSFPDLCERPLGAADYVAIARRFHTVIIDGVAVLGPEKRNEARRFVWLIDALYDMRVKLLASAAAEPGSLYLGTEGMEAFEFARAVSRLMEMRSQSYLALPHGRPSSEASGDVTGLVET
jgi:cell division protein ZapE